MSSLGGSTQSPSKNSFKKQLAVLVAVAAVVILGIAGVNAFPTVSNQGYAPEQPIPFSHKLHAGQYKIDCLYCHGTAEKSAHAGVPSTNVCMNCHKVVKTDSPWIQQLTQAYNEGRPIEWVRIHELPDHAHFVHSRHIKAGVSCQTCHGPIETMDRVYQASALNMGWCMNCHRGDTTPPNVLRAYHPDLKDPKGHAVASVNCTTCHY